MRLHLCVLGTEQNIVYDSEAPLSSNVSLALKTRISDEPRIMREGTMFCVNNQTVKVVRCESPLFDLGELYRQCQEEANGWVIVIDRRYDGDEWIYRFKWAPKGELELSERKLMWFLTEPVTLEGLIRQ